MNDSDNTVMRINEDNHLVCCVCGSIYLHQEKVTVFGRKEDAKKGVHAQIVGDSINVDDDVETGNPSSRRQSVIVFFSCEGCLSEISLVFSQHKGNTEVYSGVVRKGDEKGENVCHLCGEPSVCSCDVCGELLCEGAGHNDCAPYDPAFSGNEGSGQILCRNCLDEYYSK